MSERGDGKKSTSRLSSFVKKHNNPKEKKDGLKISSKTLKAVLDATRRNDPSVAEIKDVGKETGHNLPMPVLSAISDILILNTHVKRLDLSACAISDEHVRTLCEALKVNNTIRYLNVSFNAITDDGVRLLAKAVGQNEGLKWVDMKNNPNSPAAVSIWCEALKHNVTLQRLEIDSAIASGGVVAMGDEIIVTDHEGTTAKTEDERRGPLEHLLEQNRQLWKVFSGSSTKATLTDRGMNFMPSLILAIPTVVSIEVSGNQFKTLPKSLRMLQRLESLSASNNRITKLPIEMGWCTSIKKLDLDGNALSNFPDSIILMKNLTHLNVARNNLTQLPLSLGSMKQLKTLIVKDNPLRGWPEKVVQSSGNAALAYMKDLLKESALCYKMKVLVVGEASVGKTSLLQQLTGGSSSSRDKAPLVQMATDGIHINEWSMKYKSTQISFCCWDFAGQDVYLYTHLFFLSQRRSVYVLVFNLLKPEEESSRIQFWLQVISARAGHAPVIIVGTHLDSPKCTKKYLDAVYATLLEKFSSKYENIRFFFALSCTTGKGVGELRSKLRSLSVPIIKEEGALPFTYSALEEKIYATRSLLQPRPTISYAQMRELVDSMGISVDKLAEVTSHLHNTGTIVHFEETGNGLNELIVLDPQWLIDIFASVLSVKHSFVKNGILLIRDLYHIWKAYPEELYSDMIHILERFDVAFRLPDPCKPGDERSGSMINANASKLLIPSRLGALRPNLTTDFPVLDHSSDEKELGRIYEFEFLPQGFLYRLIMKCLRTDWEIKHAWKAGALLSRRKGLLLIEFQAQANAHRLTLQLRGDNMANNMLVLAATVDSLIGTWLNINSVGVYIPFIDYDLLGEPPYLFTLYDVHQAVLRGETMVKCRGLMDVSIFALAPDLVAAEIENIHVSNEDITARSKLFRLPGGRVEKAVFRKEDVSVRVFSKNSVELKAARDRRRELAFSGLCWLVKGIDHANIVGVHGLRIGSTHVEVVREPVSVGTLYEVIHNSSTPIDWGFRVKVARDVAQAMSFAHGINPPLVHRDLCSHSIMVVRTQEDGKDALMAKVADFPMHILRPTELILTEEYSGPRTYWLAPEVLMLKPYDERADIYSYGILLWEILTRMEWLEGAKTPAELREAHSRLGKPTIPSDCFPEYANLIERCLSKEPGNRPAWEDILDSLTLMANKQKLDKADVHTKNLHLLRTTSRVFTRGPKPPPLLPRDSLLDSLLEESSEGGDAALRENTRRFGTSAMGKRQPSYRNSMIHDRRGRHMSLYGVAGEDSTGMSDMPASELRVVMSAMMEENARLKEQVGEQNAARIRAERNLAFQVLDNDRKEDRINKLLLKVRNLKLELDELHKGDQEAHKRIVRTPNRRTSVGGSLGRAAGGAAIRRKTVTLVDGERSEDKPRFSNPSASAPVATARVAEGREDGTRASKSGDVEDVASTQQDIQAIQESLRRRYVSHRIINRLKFFETLSTEGESSASLFSAAMQSSSPREDGGSGEASGADHSSSSAADVSRPDKSKWLKKSKGTSVRNMGTTSLKKASLERAESLSGGTDESESMMHQIFYGKEELVRLLLDMDEFDFLSEASFGEGD